MKKLSIDYIRSKFEEEGYILLTIEYKDSRQKLKYICPEEHRHFISWESWRHNRRCGICSNNIKRQINEIDKEFKKEGYTLLTKKYKNNKQKLECICPIGHIYSISWNNWQKKKRCIICYNLRRSFILKELWKTQLHQEKVKNGRTLKPNKPELVLITILNNLFPNEYKYVGDYQFWIDGKNPDFMNVNGQKKLI